MELCALIFSIFDFQNFNYNMHIKSILSHQWLSMTRSTIWERQLATKILAGFALSYLLFCFLFIGFNLGKIIQLVSPNSDSVYIVSQIIIYFIAFDLMMRVFMQSIPRLQVAPYLHLNLSKQKLANIFLFKSVANIFNLYPLVIILPFALIEIPVNYSLSASIGFIVGLILIILMNNFLALFIKLIAQKYFVFHFLPVIIVLGIFAFVSSKVLDIGLFSALLGLSFLKFSLAFPAFAALILCFFLISKKFLTGEMYIDQLSRCQN